MSKKRLRRAEESPGHWKHVYDVQTHLESFSILVVDMMDKMVRIRPA